MRVLRWGTLFQLPPGLELHHNYPLFAPLHVSHWAPACRVSPPPPRTMVNIPKTKKAYCKGPECRRHTMHKVTQYKKGKDSSTAQGACAGGGRRAAAGA